MNTQQEIFVRRSYRANKGRLNQKTSERKNYFWEICPNKIHAATLDFARKMKIVEKSCCFFSRFWQVSVVAQQAAEHTNMSNLYRIIVLHGAPKDSHTSTETYLVAEDENEVFDWINKKNHGSWTDEDEEEPRVKYADDDYEKEISFREWVMINRGDLADEDGWEDAYYGVTKWGWELINASSEDISILVRLGIAKLA